MVNDVHQLTPTPCKVTALMRIPVKNGEAVARGGRTGPASGPRRLAVDLATESRGPIEKGDAALMIARATEWGRRGLFPLLPACLTRPAAAVVVRRLRFYFFQRKRLNATPTSAFVRGPIPPPPPCNAPCQPSPAPLWGLSPAGPAGA